MTPGFRHDVIMSLRRRAYAWIVAGSDREDWYEHMRMLCTAFGDHPCYQALADRYDLWETIWDHADAAVAFGRDPKKQFPMMLDLERAGHVL